MKKVILSVFLLLAWLPATAQTGMVTVEGSSLVDSSGTLITGATISFDPVNNEGTPISYHISGKGQAIDRPVTAQVTNGAFTITVADTSLTSPVNVCYAVTVTENASGDPLLGPGYSCVQPEYSNYWCTSGVCNFDDYTPNGQPGVVATSVPTSADWPNAGTCPSGQYVNGLSNGSSPACSTPPTATGNVTGPSSSTASDIVLYGDGTGKVISDSGVNWNPITGTLQFPSAVTIAAGGTNQNITLTPTGTGYLGIGGSGTLGGSIVNVDSNLGISLFDSISNFTSNIPILRGAITASSFSASTDFFEMNVAHGSAIFASGQGNPFTYWGVSSTGTEISPQLYATMPIPKTALDVDGSFRSKLIVVTFSATPTFNAYLGNTEEITLTGNVTSSTLSNAVAGETINFIICQDSTGGHTFTWPTQMHGAMTIGTTASTCSVQSFIYDGTNAYATSSGVANE